jgi:tyrosyl-tRNA synthetase
MKRQDFARYLRQTSPERVERGWRSLAPRLRKRPSRRVYALAAFAVLVLVAIGFAKPWSKSPTTEGTVIETEPGQTQAVILAEGSRVILGPSSRLALVNVSADRVRLRLDREQPLTFLEFNYMILQAYDFLELSRRAGCRAQFGGSDQWGNIVNGIELARRVDATELFGVTTPLITTADGAKMGKTAQGAVWLDEQQLSPYDYWQFWRNTQDADVGRFLKLFTDLSLEDIGKLESLAGAEINNAKIVLATEATAMLHGRETALAAEQTARETFVGGGAGQDLPTLSVGEGMNIAHALTALGFTPSNKEAKRKIAEGAVRLDDVTVNDPALTLIARDEPLKLSLGKKRHALLVR